jgi:hypothetical protein
MVRNGQAGDLLSYSSAPAIVCGAIMHSVGENDYHCRVIPYFCGEFKTMRRQVMYRQGSAESEVFAHIADRYFALSENNAY